MHIGIDNAVNGHGQRAVDAVVLYLENLRRTAGEAAVQIAWRRIWNGYVAFGSIGSFGQDLVDLITTGPSLREQMIAMIERKASFGSRNHQQHMVGPSRIDEWFADPEGFLDALLEHEWITAGDWHNGRIRALMDFETGPMYRVFTEDEIALWDAYTTGLTNPPAPAPAKVSPALAMTALIDQLRPIQRGVSGHVTNTLADSNGVVHPLAWWFEQPTRTLMEALASPLNDVIVPGHPESSRFYMELTAPTGPMGKVFGLPATSPNQGMCREVLHDWIVNGCPLVSQVHRSLRLSTPPGKRDRHPTGHIYGMGGIH
jgi:hypothetical protein